MRFFKCLVVSLVSIFFLVSCDWLTDEPVVDKENLEFSALGGEEIVNVFMHNGKVYEGNAHWSIEGLQEKDAKIDTLKDGRIKHSLDWVEFILTPNKKNIRVVVSENKTGKERKTSFDGGSRILGFTIYVKQRAE